MEFLAGRSRSWPVGWTAGILVALWLLIPVPAMAQGIWHDGPMASVPGTNCGTANPERLINAYVGWFGDTPRRK
jgi:hypothetical protein